MGAALPLIISGTVIFILFAVLGFGGLDMIMQAAVGKMLVLTEGTRIWSLWKTMPLPIYIRLRFFNITNPEEFAEGAMAKLQECGPYVYLEDWEKVDVQTDEDGDIIRYRMTKTYFFQPELSKGSEDDVITFINLILVSSAVISNEKMDDDFMLAQMNDMLTEKGERLTRTGTVRQIIFDGVSVQTYVDIFKNPIVEEMAAELGLGIPENIKDGLFAMFKHKNGTDDGWFEVKSGRGGSEQVAKIVSYNGDKLLKNWRGEPCNTINGTDGTFHPPFLTRETTKYIFAPPMCRSFALEYHSDVETNGVQSYRFVASLKNWMSPQKNPDNWCFCDVKKNSTMEETCVNNGVFSIAPCAAGAPILISQPHFYGADDWILNAVEGLKPEFEKHMTVMDFHPLTGSPVQAYGRMQLSIEVVPYESMSLFSKVKHAIVPFAWIEEGSSVQGDELMGLKLLDSIQNGFFYARFVFMTIGILLIGIGAFLLVGNKKPRVPKTPKPKSSKTKTEVEGVAPDFGSAFAYT